MEKEEIDELYHLLRKVSNEPRDPALSFSVQYIMRGMANHLLAGGDYLSLVQFSQYYGEMFLLDPTAAAIHVTGWKFSRVVEFGAGLGWLARGLAIRLEVGYVTVDKRPWTAISIMADLETEIGVDKVKENLLNTDLIVMSDFLHCLEDPLSLMTDFADWPMVVLEYSPSYLEYLVSYADQIKRYGATPFTPEDLDILFSGRETVIADLDPYTLILAEKKKQ